MNMSLIKLQIFCHFGQEASHFTMKLLQFYSYLSERWVIGHQNIVKFQNSSSIVALNNV